jgi:hypothetical protein
MVLERLFQVLVVMGASSTVGLTACGGDDGDDGAGGTSGAGGSAPSTGGATATGGSGGSSSAGEGGSGGGDACEAECGPNATNPAWTDCGGCCCWLAPGATGLGVPICGEEPCCEGRGR